MTRLILASGSKARADILANAGISFDVIPADIDESAIIQAYDGHDPGNLAAILAAEKAKAISVKYPQALVIGGDQILEHNGQVLQKAANKDAAIDKLKRLSGQMHSLISAVCVAQNSEILWKTTGHAQLHMAEMSAEEIQAYADKAGGEVLTKCVGAYELEGIGAGLFEEIDGDYFTILGMPLIPLLRYLRTRHDIKAF